MLITGKGSENGRDAALRDSVGSEEVARRGVDLAGADCLLFTGTGMPTLAAIETLGPELGIPVLSTNLCLAWSICRALGVTPPPGPHPLLNGWQARRALL